MKFITTIWIHKLDYTRGDLQEEVGAPARLPRSKYEEVSSCGAGDAANASLFLFSPRASL